MRRIAIIGGVVAGLAVAGVGAWWALTPRASVFYTDADAIRRATGAASPRDILWRPPARLDAPLNTDGDDYEPRFAWDGLTLYFVRGKAGENADIFVTRRTADGWTEPAPVPGVNSEYDDLGPAPAADSETLHFYSNRPGGLGGYDLWAARRDGDAWQPPTNLGPQVNSPFNDYGPTSTPDGRRLLFSSNRPPVEDARQPSPDAWPATLREDLFTRTYDLYTSTLDAHGPSSAAALAGLNSPANEGAPCVSPVGDFVYFSSDRPGGAGGFDLYRARLLRGDPQRPVLVGDGLNTAANELDPGLTQLGYALYFSSDRAAAVDGARNATASATEDTAHRAVAPASDTGRPRYDLYYTTAREVFTETDAAAAIDWAALLRQIGPQLTWLLLGLMALLLLLAFLRDMKDRRLSLLARCLLLSLLAHLLLLVSFSFWRVAAGVAAAVRGGGPVRISMSGPATGGTLAAQVRGNVTALEPPPAQASAMPAAALPAFTPPSATLASFTAPPTALRIEPQASVMLLAAEAAPPPTLASAPPAVAFEVTPPTFDVQTPAEAARVAVDEAAPVQSPVAAMATPERTQPRFDVPASQPAARLAAHPVAATNGDFERVMREAAQAASTSAGAAPAGGAMDAAVGASASALPPLAASDALGASPLEASVALPAAPAAQSKTTAGSAAPRAGPVAAVVPHAPRVSIDGVAGGSRGGAVPRFEARDVPVSAGGLALAADVEIAPISGMGSVGDAPVGSPDAPAIGSSSGGSADVGPAAGATTTATPELALGDLPGLGGGEFGLPTETAAPPAPPRSGWIAGQVRDARTRAPLADATIRLDLPDGQSRTAVTDAEGRYALELPAAMPHVAVSAEHDGHLPLALNVPVQRARRGDVRVNFTLEPQSDDVVALEPSPEVHHLGNDAFEGSVNSQFQRESEGRALTTRFIVPSDDPANEFRRAEITLLAKGVQCPHDVRINGQRVRGGLPVSPDDGSFGEVVLRVDVNALRTGPNTLRIATTTCQGDLDDFEFVNVQVRLRRDEPPGR